MPQERYGGDYGNSISGPIRSRRPYGIKGQRGAGAAVNVSQFEAESYGWSPRTRISKLEEFDGALDYVDLYVPLFDVTNDANTILVGANSRGYVEVPQGGYLVEASLAAEDALAESDTNYITFSVTNNLASGSGSTAMLLATDVNTTKVAGEPIIAIIGRPLYVHTTAANTRVAKGDVLTVLAAVTGTLVNAVDNPVVHLRFAVAATSSFTPRIVRTAGSPLVGPVVDSANGEQIMQLSATNEINVAGLDWEDQRTIHPQRGWRFEAWIKVSAIAANERVVFGLMSDFAATFDDTTLNAWFRLEGSLVLLVEVDDGTTNVDDQSTGVTLTADTYAYFRIELTDEGEVRFWHGDNIVKKITTITMPAIPLMQPAILVQKDSGTGTPSATIDMNFTSWDRF